jgi:hypothetical protein
VGYDEGAAREACRSYLACPTDRHMDDALRLLLPIAQIAVAQTYGRGPDFDGLANAGLLRVWRVLERMEVDPDHVGFFTFVRMVARSGVLTEARALRSGGNVVPQIFDDGPSWSRSSLGSVSSMDAAIYLDQIWDLALDRCQATVRFSGSRGGASRYILEAIRRRSHFSFAMIRMRFGLSRRDYDLIVGYCERLVRVALYAIRDEHGPYVRRGAEFFDGLPG